MKPPTDPGRYAAIVAAYDRGLARGRDRPGFPKDEPAVLDGLMAVYAAVPNTNAKEIVQALRWRTLDQMRRSA